MLLIHRPALHPGVLRHPPRVVAVPCVPFVALRLFFGCLAVSLDVTRSGFVSPVLARFAWLFKVPGIDVAVLLSLLVRSQCVSLFSSLAFFGFTFVLFSMVSRFSFSFCMSSGVLLITSFLFFASVCCVPSSFSNFVFRSYRKVFFVLSFFLSPQISQLKIKNVICLRARSSKIANQAFSFRVLYAVCIRSGVRFYAVFRRYLQSLARLEYRRVSPYWRNLSRTRLVRKGNREEWFPS